MTTFTSWDSELYHHGIKGQKWGVRRYQNPDGTLTAEGKARYNEALDNPSKKNARFLDRIVLNNTNKADNSLYKYFTGKENYINKEIYYFNKYAKKHGVAKSDNGKVYTLFPDKIEKRLNKQKAKNLENLIDYATYRSRAQKLLSDPRIANYDVKNLNLEIRNVFGVPTSYAIIKAKK